MRPRVMTARRCLQVVKTSPWSSRVETMFGATLHTRGRILLNRVTLHLPSITTTTITRMSRKSRHCQSLAPQPLEVRAVLLRAIMERREGKRLVFSVSTKRFNTTFSRLQTWWYTGRLAATCLALRARSDPLNCFIKLLTPSLLRMGKTPTWCCRRI